MRIKRAEELAEQITDWCVTKFGYSKYHDGLPIIEVCYSDGKGIKGEYETFSNIIYYYTKEISSVRQLVQTVIHEYVHYLQSPVWLERYQQSHGQKKNKRHKNKYEVYAEDTAMMYYKQCMHDLELK